MIHIRLDGVQIAKDVPFFVFPVPYDNVVGVVSPVTIGNLVAVNVFSAVAPPPQDSFYYECRNISTGGQIIFLDVANTVTSTQFSWILYPGESLQLDPFNLNVWAIASAAGGSLTIVAPFAQD